MSDERLNITGDPEALKQPDVQRTLAELRALSETTILLDRMRWANLHGVTFEGNRDEYRILGYPRAVTYKDYRDEYDRGGVAGRIIDVMPDACWRGDPAFEIIEDEDPENETPFEKAWLEIAQKHQVIPKLIRTDKLARLSTYSVILIGARGNNLEAPLPKASGPESLLYLMPFSGGGGPGANDNRTVAGDASATIKEYEEDPSNERFGLPKSYQLKRIDVTSSALLRPVHWTRIVHVAEGVLEDDVYGQPALQRVWNLLIDLRKVTGGGAEAFWLRANQGMHLNIDKDMALPSGDDTIERLKEQSELYKHQLTRWLRTRGVTVTPLGSDVANFENPADAILTQIAGAKAIPKRILTGSEMGELASSQDRENFKDQIVGRQLAHCGPNIVRPLVDRLIEFGYLPEPKGGPREYQVKWPHIQVLTEDEKSAGALKWSQTKIGEDPVFTDAEIRDKWYGMAPLSEEQIAAIDERKAEAVKRQQEAMGGGPNAPKDEDEDDEEEETLKAAEDSEMVKVLAAAIAAGDTDIIDQITGVERPVPNVVIDPKTIADVVVPHIVGHVKRYGLVPRAAGGPGSGNFGHAGRPGEVGGSAPDDGPKAEARREFKRLKDAWAVKNNELFKFVDTPDSPEAKAHLNEMKALVKEMHTLDADPGDIESIGAGLPGGPRDVVIVGGGPGGLAAAINGGAEGYDTLLIEGSKKVGGQSRQSTRIENLPGFPLGVSGERLASSMEDQSLRLGAEHKLGTKVVGIEYDPETDLKTVTLSNGEKIEARTVILAGGLSQQTHAPWDKGSPDVSYGQPERVLADAQPGRDMAIAGGSNGAAQAAVAAAEAGAEVSLVSRSELEKSMSAYQIGQVRNHPRIRSIVGDIKKHEKGKLTLEDGRTVVAEKIGVFYGQRPDSAWMAGITRDENGRVVTSRGDFQTSIPGVFAVGDITTNGAGRIGVAIGEGQQAVKGLHQYFETLKARLRGRTRRAASERMLADRPVTSVRRKWAGDIRTWNTIVDQAFDLDNERPWHGQTIEGEKPPRRPHYLQKRAAGGAGSGNFGHSGRPGQVGGSAPKDGAQEISAVPVVKKNSRIISRIQGPKVSDPYAELPVQQQAYRFKDKPSDPAFQPQREGLPFGYGDAVSNIQGPADPNPRAELPVKENSLQDPNYQSIEIPIEIEASDEEPLGDSNLNEVLHLTTPSGEELVFKPVDGEHFRAPGYDDEEDAPLVRDDISNEDAPLAEREVLAYRVDQELGLGMTPNTVYGDYEGRPGAAIDFIEDARDGAFGANAKDAAKVGVFDAVIGNQDRHSGNAMTKDGKLIAIDHGFAFGTTPPGGYIRSWALAGIGPDDIPVPEQKALADRLDKFDFSKVLKGSHLDEREIDTFRERVALIANRLRLGEAHLIKSDFDTSAW